MDKSKMYYVLPDKTLEELHRLNVIVPSTCKQHVWAVVVEAPHINMPFAKVCTECGYFSRSSFFGHNASHLDIQGPEFRGKPHLWIQWKGTKVCCDIICECGASFHFDGDFFYFFRCPGCKAVFESGTFMPIYKVTDGRADGAVIQEIEDDWEWNEDRSAKVKKDGDSDVKA